MGLVVATGNVGTHLEQEPDEAEMFVSRDAGRSWSRVMEGSAAYDIGTICVCIYIYAYIFTICMYIYTKMCTHICVSRDADWPCIRVMEGSAAYDIDHN